MVVSFESFCDLEEYMEDILTGIWKFFRKFEKTHSGSEIAGS